MVQARIVPRCSTRWRARPGSCRRSTGSTSASGSRRWRGRRPGGRWASCTGWRAGSSCSPFNVVRPEVPARGQGQLRAHPRTPADHPEVRRVAWRMGFEHAYHWIDFFRWSQLAAERLVGAWPAIEGEEHFGPPARAAAAPCCSPPTWVTPRSAPWYRYPLRAGSRALLARPLRHRRGVPHPHARCAATSTASRSTPRRSRWCRRYTFCARVASWPATATATSTTRGGRSSSSARRPSSRPGRFSSPARAGALIVPTFFLLAPDRRFLVLYEPPIPMDRRRRLARGARAPRPRRAASPSSSAASASSPTSGTASIRSGQKKAKGERRKARGDSSEQRVMGGAAWERCGTTRTWWFGNAGWTRQTGVCRFCAPSTCGAVRSGFSGPTCRRVGSLQHRRGLRSAGNGRVPTPPLLRSPDLPRVIRRTLDGWRFLALAFRLSPGWVGGQNGWGVGIRTPIPWSRATCPAVGRLPSNGGMVIVGRSGGESTVWGRSGPKTLEGREHAGPRAVVAPLAASTVGHTATRRLIGTRAAP